MEFIGSKMKTQSNPVPSRSKYWSAFGKHNPLQYMRIIVFTGIVAVLLVLGLIQFGQLYKEAAKRVSTVLAKTHCSDWAILAVPIVILASLCSGFDSFASVCKLIISECIFKFSTESKGAPSIENGPSNEAKSSIENGPSNEAKPSIENGPSNEAKPSMENGPSNEARPSIENGPSNEARPSIETSPTNEAALLGYTTLEHPAIHRNNFNVNAHVLLIYREWNDQNGNRGALPGIQEATQNEGPGPGEVFEYQNYQEPFGGGTNQNANPVPAEAPHLDQPQQQAPEAQASEEQHHPGAPSHQNAQAGEAETNEARNEPPYIKLKIPVPEEGHTYKQKSQWEFSHVRAT